MRLSVGVIAVGLLAGFGARAMAQDASMSCQQLADAVKAQNAIIKDAMDDQATLQNSRPDPGDRDPAIGERLDQMKADKATARAKTLVALGRQKQCFK
jgi:hypothetical protein